MGKWVDRGWRKEAGEKGGGKEAGLKVDNRMGGEGGRGGRECHTQKKRSSAKRWDWQFLLLLFSRTPTEEVSPPHMVARVGSRRWIGVGPFLSIHPSIHLSVLPGC